DQPVRNPLIDGKPQIAFLACVRRDGLLERRISFHWRVQTDVVLERREIDDDTTQLERRNAVTDRLGCIRRRFRDRRAYPAEDRLRLRRTSVDVLVDRFGSDTSARGERPHRAASSSVSADPVCGGTCPTR